MENTSKVRQVSDLSRIPEVITVIDEPTYDEDMEKLLSHYAEKLLGKEKSRFQCDFMNCKRVLMSTNTRSFKCTACGHGAMRPER